MQNLVFWHEDHNSRGHLDVESRNIKNICENSSILKIGQNIKYDLRILNKYKISLNSIADTMLLSYALDNGLVKHNMDDLAYTHFQHSCIKYKDVVGSGKKEITFDYVPINIAVDYAAEDALITLKLFNCLFPRCIKEKSLFIYQEIDLPLINVLALMEKEGIKVDNKYLEKLSKDFEIESKNLEKKIFKLSKKEFNIGSPKQLGEILFSDLQFPGGKKTKSGIFSTDLISLDSMSKTASLAPPWAGPHSEAIPAAIHANGFAPDEPASRTVDVEAFCS